MTAVFLKGVTEIICHVPLPHGLQGLCHAGLFSVPGLPCESGGAAVLLEEGQTPVQEARTRHQRVGSPGHLTRTGGGAAPATGNKGFKEADVSFRGKGGRQEATEPF